MKLSISWAINLPKAHLYVLNLKQHKTIQRRFFWQCHYYVEKREKPNTFLFLPGPLELYLSNNPCKCTSYSQIRSTENVYRIRHNTHFYMFPYDCRYVAHHFKLGLKRAVWSSNLSQTKDDRKQQQQPPNMYKSCQLKRVWTIKMKSPQQWHLISEMLVRRKMFVQFFKRIFLCVAKWILR